MGPLYEAMCLRREFITGVGFDDMAHN